MRKSKEIWGLGLGKSVGAWNITLQEPISATLVSQRNLGPLSKDDLHIHPDACTTASLSRNSVQQTGVFLRGYNEIFTLLSYYREPDFSRNPSTSCQLLPFATSQVDQNGSILSPRDRSERRVH